MQNDEARMTNDEDRRLIRHSSFVLRHSSFRISLSSRDGAVAPPRRSVEDSTAKHPPTRPTQ